MSDCPAQIPDESAAFEAWLEYGWARRWCGPPVCSTCDGVPCTEDEIEAADCVHVLRLYDSLAQAQAVAADHSPTVWRAINRGWAR